ncbi:helix-turn-helix transcriptional regulator [Candidatus Woesearchaeota archaeon]|jgi:predicted transcriptional regulator|nr:helix-turn-helix transcriptional regulator [Candidatus Woesearchaeota archaeon]MBT3536978.1 helix-turn-helix transcriptional regulator [Candidatus Woesearchaeota archaeon]MBT4697588.1 helix-turn-helix transcriptional regulator [Candidatus Woesearchaeota archaeon]MBT4717702.1 helix-turn-helix transcriptional regulator [Candidatus Woesearchaeota archaeon]MBT7106712.1 helix-turn-helix transcriptional regulator [Candidatus Woesearchaeota archaeon]
MKFISHKITIVSSNKPAESTLNDELQWLGTTLGLFGNRDKDNSCFRIFIELLKSTRRNKAMSSDAISLKLNLSRGTVVHHLNKMMQSGIVLREGNTYALRANTLQAVIEEVQKDVNRTFYDMMQIAKEIDDGLGI